MRLRAGRYEIRFPRPALVMGIVNVTPDSFSDSGQFLSPGAAIERALELVRQGAELIDVGGESSRPGALPVSEAEELDRVMPVIEGLAGKVEVPISIDTMKAGVAREALKAGASMVNDVGANRQEPEMWELVAETGAGYVCMHMKGTPQTMQLNPHYTDVSGEVSEFFAQKMAALAGCGVKTHQVILDPGIGFGKKIEHNIAILGALRTFDRFDRPLLVGVSRKSFLSQGSGKRLETRLPAALACACLAVEAGVKMIRAHDVAETVQAIRMAEAILARGKQ
ncbi:MAG: dihydropteroate synthase [Limisphaerales bacterium]